MLSPSCTQSGEEPKGAGAFVSAHSSQHPYLGGELSIDRARFLRKILPFVRILRGLMKGALMQINPLHLRPRRSARLGTPH